MQTQLSNKSNAKGCLRWSVITLKFFNTDNNDVADNDATVFTIPQHLKKTTKTDMLKLS